MNLIRYVLLKERNMLKTMEHECNEEMEMFPSPERIDKVEQSMKNLEEVVRERNEAYYYLETGETGEQPSHIVHNVFGMIIKNFSTYSPIFGIKYIEE